MRRIFSLILFLGMLTFSVHAQYSPGRYAAGPFSNLGDWMGTWHGLGTNAFDSAGSAATVQSNLNIEISRATNAEFVLQTQITTETNRAIQTEIDIQNNLNIASNALHSVDTNLQAQIIAETNRAYQAETNIQTQIDSATNRIAIAEGYTNYAFLAWSWGNWRTNYLNWAMMTGTPDTISGYGITDAFTKVENDARFATTGSVAALAADLADHKTNVDVHAIAAITGLQTALDGKASTGDMAQAQSDIDALEGLTNSTVYTNTAAYTQAVAQAAAAYPASDPSNFQGQITANAGLGSTNAANINTISGRVDVAEGNISTNAANIATNAAAVATVSGRVDQVEGLAITNAAAIATVSQRVDVAEGNISTNSTRIDGVTNGAALGVTAVQRTGDTMTGPLTNLTNVVVMGRLGVGTDTNIKSVCVAGDIGISGGLYELLTTDTYLKFNNDELRFYAGNERMLILHEDGTQDYVEIGDGGDIDVDINDDVFIEGSSGNVGIGTTALTERLHVNGNVIVTGSVTAASFSGDGSGLTGITAAQVGAVGTNDFADHENNLVIDVLHFTAAEKILATNSVQPATLEEHTTNDVIHVTAGDKTKWDSITNEYVNIAGTNFAFRVDGSNVYHDVVAKEGVFYFDGKWRYQMTDTNFSLQFNYPGWSNVNTYVP